MTNADADLAGAGARPAAGRRARRARQDKKDKKAKGKKAAGASVTVTFTTDQRGAAQGWYVETYGQRQLPARPRQEEQRLPAARPGEEALRGRPAARLRVSYKPIPAELSVRIGKPPEGYLYVTLDGDLLKLAVGTLLVVDAIDGLLN